MSQPSEPANVCVHCGTLNEPPADFCVKCGGPLTAHAVFDPFDSIKSQGFMYRSASRSPQSGIVVVGVWILLLPMFGLGMYVALGTLAGLLREGFHPIAFVTLGLGGLLAWVSGTLMTRTLANYQRVAEENANRDEDADGEEDHEEEGGEEYWREPADETDSADEPTDDDSPRGG